MRLFPGCCEREDATAPASNLLDLLVFRHRDDEKLIYLGKGQ